MTPLEDMIRGLIARDGIAFYTALETIVYDEEVAAFRDIDSERTHKIFEEWCRATVCARNLKESVYRAEKLEHDRDMAAIEAITPGKSDVRRKT